MGPMSPPWAREAAIALAAAVPGARSVALEGEDHAVVQRPAALAPVLVEFFGNS